MRAAALCALALGAAAAFPAAAAPAAATDAAVAADRWHELLQARRDDVARAECAAMSTSKDDGIAAEGFKCLANLELRGADHVQIDAKGAGGVMRPGLHGEAVDRALGHLQSALAKAPQDLSIHQGRFDVLLAASRFEEIPKALQNSILTHPGTGDGQGASDALDVWLGVSSDLFALGRMDECLAVSRVLEVKWPSEHRVIGNIGSVLSVLEKDDEALRYLQRATELAPADPIDRWNLARLLDFMGRDDDAAAAYARWSELETDSERRARSSCVYATFVQEKRKDLPRACRLQQEFCAPEQRSACEQLAAAEADEAGTPAPSKEQP